MLDAGDCPPGPTSVIDCTGELPVVLRQGYRPVHVP
jgi:tRNA A37 threonylcarbamoyladenosine synthetase subunit TsaC/SUA5/YrdC